MAHHATASDHARDGILALLARGWRRLRRDDRARASASMLYQLDDHLLRDIGVHPGDFRAEVFRVGADRQP
jgi:uncharacterized protein YjiS (DUF1127 family)